VAAGSGGWMSGGARRALAKLGEVTGAGAIARVAVGTHDALIERLTSWALDNGVPEATVKRALAAYAKTQRVQSYVAILLPFVPNPAALRALAGADDSNRKARESSAAVVKKRGIR